MDSSFWLLIIILVLVVTPLRDLVWVTLLTLDPLVLGLGIVAAFYYMRHT